MYASGGDLVLLGAQIVSATSDPKVDLAITKTPTGPFTVGSNGSYLLHVSNVNGSFIENETNTVTVSDTLPAGLSFVSATGGGWTCGAAGQVVTCTHPAPLNAGQSFPDITLTVAIGPAAAPSVSNTASVSSATFDGDAGNNAATAVTPVTTLPATLRVLKTSEVLSDPRNGTTNPKRIPGAIVRYRVEVANLGSGSADASSIAIVDPVPAGTAMYVSSAGGPPVDFVDGTPASGLSFNYATNVSYSNQPGGAAPFNYTPTADANGVDLAVTAVRIVPTGTLLPAGGSGNPSFSLRFRVIVR
ncbi:MAG: DUF11 domain-containing protein [Steroidobacteraceae bacterium]